MAKTDQPAKGADSSKAGAATSPQSTANARTTHQVAEGHQISLQGKVYGAGHKVSAADFITKADTDGKRGLQRLVDGGELAKSTSKGDDERAGGGSIDNGGATGAGPSAAQIIAAEAGDKGSQDVVKAALTGSEADFTEAATPDSKKA